MFKRRPYRKCSKSDNTDITENNVIPPWCSSGRVNERRKPRKVTPVYNIKSFYARRENIWEYLNDDKAGNFGIETSISRRKLKKQTLIKLSKCGNAILLIFFVLCSGIMIRYIMRPKLMPKLDEIMEILPKSNFFSYLRMDSTPVNEECCYRMKHLALALNRAEQALSDLRFRKTLLRSRMKINTEIQQASQQGTQHIEGVMALKGGNTSEWGGNVAFWGILPVWRTAPPPDTVLKLRKPIPSDCWPFRGSYGELVLDLPKKIPVTKLSVEHIRPDTARSAPKKISVFGILVNGTWIKAADGIYEYNKPAKQYFHLNNTDITFQRIVFRVLSNQGNMRYTCIYRIRIYTSYTLFNNKYV